MMKPWTKVLVGATLLIPGLTAWLGPVLVEYGILPILAGLAVAGAVVGGFMLVVTGTYDLTYDNDERTSKSR